MHALETLPRGEKVDRTQVTARIGHAHVPGARRVFDRLEVVVLDETWSQDVTYHLSVPRTAVEALKGELGELTRGQAEVRSEI